MAKNSAPPTDEWKVVAAAVRPYLRRKGDAEFVAEEIIRGLAMAGIVLVELDTPYAIANDGTQYFGEGSKEGAVQARPGDGVVYHGAWEWTTNQAVDVAREWLSAASVAGLNRLEQEPGGAGVDRG